MQYSHCVIAVSETTVLGASASPAAALTGPGPGCQCECDCEYICYTLDKMADILADGFLFIYMLRYVLFVIFFFIYILMRGCCNLQQKIHFF